MKHIFLTIYILLLSNAVIHAQEVTNVRFEQSGKQMIIIYDLTGETGSAYKVDIYCSSDGGKTWGNSLKMITGETGNDIKPGINKKAIWDVLAEREKLEGEVSFKVKATESEKSGTYTGSRDVATKKTTIEWVSIPAGTFTMGSPPSETGRNNDETQHQVTLSAFKMSRYEVTFEQYDAFCEATGRKKPDDRGWGRGERPVINVSWDDAKAFAGWMGCRLPTEAEWEYACRAGTTTPFNTGNNLTTSQANYNGNYPDNGNAKGEYRAKTLPVGSFSPNNWGLYDMHGNVWEWCSDWYGDYKSFAQADGSETGSYRVYRGGCWYDTAPYCRAAYRNDRNPGLRGDGLGFRLVSPE